MAASSSGTFTATQELVVTWAYAPTGGFGRVHNPYVAVWVEGADGVPVRIVHFETPDRQRPPLGLGIPLLSGHFN